jgi:hypothetical protein
MSSAWSEREQENGGDTHNPVVEWRFSMANTRHGSDTQNCKPFAQLTSQRKRNNIVCTHSRLSVREVSPLEV